MLALPIGLADMDVHHYDVACVRSARVEISSIICVSVCVCCWGCGQDWEMQPLCRCTIGLSCGAGGG